MTAFNVGSASDVGQIRSNNQDSKLVDSGQNLFAVADGMGGHQGGEVASAIAVEILQTSVTEATTDTLVGAVRKANTEVFERASADENLRGMGTTLVAIALVNIATDDEEVAWINVGDSRVYLLRDGDLRQLSTDHSLIEDLKRGGQLTDEEAAIHPQRNIITRALGIDDDVQVDSGGVVPYLGDQFLLCSDGLFNEVSEAAISTTLTDFTDPDEAATELVRQANAGGGRDNITVVIAVVTDDDGRSARAATAAAAAAAAAAEMRAAYAEEETQEPEPESGDAVEDDEEQTPSTESPPVTTEALGTPPEGGNFPSPNDPGFPTDEEETNDLDLPFGRETSDLYGDLDQAGGKHRALSALVTAAIVAVLLGGSYFGLKYYANNGYYLDQANNSVVIMRGRPGGFLIFDPVIQETFPFDVSDLPPEARRDVKAQRKFSSLDNARSFLNTSYSQAEAQASTTTTTTTTKPAVTPTSAFGNGQTTTTQG